jgi:hypothetical protein
LINDKIKLLIKNFEAKSVNHFILRKDGICLYSNFSRKGFESTIALMAGMWQASEALGEFANLENEEGRICFESSSSGIIIHKFLNNSDLIYAVQYKNVLNPGFFKMKLKRLIKAVDLELESSIREVIVTNDNEFLFSEISDDEINRIFNF